MKQTKSESQMIMIKKHIIILKYKEQNGFIFLLILKNN
jgi:hypothetical protein